MEPVSEPPLNATRIVSILNKHGVHYVVIGAFAAIAQRAPIPPTRDIDFTPDASRSNLDNLSAALKELKARIRTDAVAGGLAFDHDGASLADAIVWNLICPDGEFDLSFAPAAFPGGYGDLEPHAHRMSIEGVEMLVADLADIIRSKEAAGRPKDLRALPVLYRHLEQVQTDGDRI
ncbi:MAG TPA: hypothetical protein VIM76_00775 [Candidatus Dormibacteraeota bacterium]